MRLVLGLLFVQSSLAAQPSVPTPEAPVVRKTVGPWSVAATVSTSGVRVRVGERAADARTTSSGRSASSGAAAARATRVLATAERFVGTKYKYGGTTARGGFDCSGFVQYVFRRHAVTLPRTSRQMAGSGVGVTPRRASLRPGDLMLFAENGKRINHVAIYAGGNRIIHSSASGGGVRYDRLDTARGRWFASHHVASRRVIANPQKLVRELDAALRAVEASAALDAPDRAPRP